MKEIKKANEPVQTIKKSKEQEEIELREELKIKKQELKDKEARMNGGFSPTLRRQMMSVDKEIKNLTKIIEMKQIEINYDAPINPKYAYEQNDRWRALRKEFLTEELENMKKGLEKIKKQEEQITIEIPILKTKINEIETKVGLEQTKFKTEKVDYIG